MTISRLILFRMRNFSEKSVGKIKTHVLCSISIFPENRAFYEIMLKNAVQPERP